MGPIALPTLSASASGLQMCPPAGCWMPPAAPRHLVRTRGAPCGLGGMGAGQRWAGAALPANRTALSQPPKQEPGTASHLGPQAPWLCLRSPKQLVRKPLGSWGSGMAARVCMSHLLLQTLGPPCAIPNPRHTCTGSPTTTPLATQLPRQSVLPTLHRQGQAEPSSCGPVSPSFGTPGISFSPLAGS